MLFVLNLKVSDVAYIHDVFAFNLTVRVFVSPEIIVSIDIDFAFFEGPVSAV